MPADDKSRKSGFDYVRLIVYIFIAGGIALFVFFRTAYTFHNVIASIGAGLLAEIVVVWCLYRMDNGRRY